MSNSVSEEVNKEFKEAKECGVDGVICPASEIAKTKEIFDLIVTPGIRLKNDDKNDQKNVATPNFAINEGAKYIVCLLYTSPSPRDLSTSRMPSSA